MNKKLLLIFVLIVFSSFVSADWVRTSSSTSSVGNVNITNNIYSCNGTSCVLGNVTGISFNTTGNVTQLNLNNSDGSRLFASFNQVGGGGGGSGTVTQIDSGKWVDFVSITTTGVIGVNSTAVVNEIGNWSADKPNYNTTNQLQSIFFNKTYINETYLTAEQTLSLLSADITYYFWDVNSTFNSTYRVMNTTQNPTLTSILVSNLVDQQVIVYRINDNTNLTTVGGDEAFAHTTLLKTTGTQTLGVKGIISKVYVNGTIVDLATTTTSTIPTGTQSVYSFSVNLEQQTLNVTDRLMWRLVAVVTGGGTPPAINVTIGNGANSALDLTTSSSITETDPIATILANAINTTNNIQGLLSNGNLTLNNLTATYGLILGNLTIPSGTVAIGTNNLLASAPLFINVTGNAEVRIETTGNNVAQFRLKNPYGEWNSQLASDGTVFRIRDVTNSRNPFVIENNTPQNTLYLNKTGFVGIGTANPLQKLHVIGDANITQTVNSLNLMLDSTIYMNGTTGLINTTGNIITSQNLTINGLLIMYNTTGRPTCSSAIRGATWIGFNYTGDNADYEFKCLTNTSGSLNWIQSGYGG